MDDDIEKMSDFLDELSQPKLNFSAQRGNIVAQTNLAVLLEDSGDYSTASKWYRFAAYQGDARSQYNLGCLLLNGKGVEQDFVEAEKWFYRASKQGYINAIYNLAFVKEHGLGCTKNKKEAYELYKSAAEKGDSDSQYRLAIILLEGAEKKKIGIKIDDHEWPISSNSKKARDLLKLASKDGHNLASEILAKLKQLT